NSWRYRRRSTAASVVEPPPNLVTDFGFGTLARAAGELVRRQSDRPARQRVVALGQDREAAVLVRERVLGHEGLRVGVADHAVDLARPQAARLEHAPRIVGAREGEVPVRDRHLGREGPAIGVAAEL